MKAYFWTVQKQDVVNVLKQYGTYQPAFEYSDYAADSEGLQNLYGKLLDSFNRVNGTGYPGLVFTFLEQDESGNIYDFRSYESFADFIRAHSLSIKSLWNNLAAKNTVIMCIEREFNDMNHLMIDINDFQYMMPPVINVWPYEEGYYDFLLNSLYNGVIPRSIFPSRVIQAHIPNIKAEEVVGLYPMFDL